MKFFLTILFFCLVFTGKAQNLIPNGDFELGADSSAEGWSLWWDITCNNPVPVNGPDFWTLIYGTPDRLLEDDLFCDFDIDTAQSGKAWVDFAPLDSGKVTLLVPLQKDSLYRLNYYASWETFNGLNTIPGRIKFNFNNGGISIVSPFISLTQWTFYDTVFIASTNSTELYISGDDSILQSGAMKLDNISLEKCPANGINSILNIKYQIIIFPNPTSNKFTIKINTQKANVEIYDSFGIILRKIENFHSGNIDVSEFSAGIYFVKVSFSNQSITQKLIIN